MTKSKFVVNLDLARISRMLERTRKLAMAAVLVAPLVGACYSYSTIPLESVAPDQTARLTLDQDGFGRIVNEAAINGFPVESMNVANNRISGRIADVSPDNVVVQLRGAGSAILTTQVATRSIQEVALRRFNRNNTLLAAGIGVAVGVAMIQGAAAGGSQGEGPEVDPENMIGLRLFSISVP